MNDKPASGRTFLLLPETEYQACLRLCKQSLCSCGPVLAALAQRALTPELLAGVAAARDQHQHRFEEILDEAGGYQACRSGTFRLQARLQPEAAPQTPAAPPTAVPAKPGAHGCSIETKPKPARAPSPDKDKPEPPKPPAAPEIS